MLLPEHLLPLGFRFVVHFDFENPGFSKGNSFKKNATAAGNYAKSGVDIMFQSVSGLSADLDTEEYDEGGENRYKHTLPLKTKYPNLVLKRGMSGSSEVNEWARNAIQNFEFQPINITVILMNDTLAPIYAWNVKDVIPVKWNVDGFNAEESKIVIETLELSYNYFTVQDTKDLIGSIPTP